MLCVRMALVMFEMPLLCSMENIVLYGYLQIHLEMIYEEEEEEEEQEVD